MTTTNKEQRALAYIASILAQQGKTLADFVLCDYDQGVIDTDTTAEHKEAFIFVLPTMWLQMDDEVIDRLYNADTLASPGCTESLLKRWPGLKVKLGQRLRTTGFDFFIPVYTYEPAWGGLLWKAWLEFSGASGENSQLWQNTVCNWSK